MQWRDDTTLPSRGPRECFQMTVKTGKAQSEQMFSGLFPEADLGAR